VLVFLIAGALALAGAVAMVLQRHPVHSALSLVVTLFSVAVLFIQMNAPFLAVVQVAVYAGAIMVLFLFVIMYLQLEKDTALGYGHWPQRILGVLAPLGLVAVLLYAALRNPLPPGSGAQVARVIARTGHTEALGRVLFDRFVLPFEIVALLLLVAMIGAIVIARAERRDEEA